jgi:hypothetical protein
VKRDHTTARFRMKTKKDERQLSSGAYEVKLKPDEVRSGRVKHKTSNYVLDVRYRTVWFGCLDFFFSLDIWMTAWSVYEGVDPNYCPSNQQASLPGTS